MTYERLAAQDASFLHIETPERPMHVGSLAVFEGGRFFDETGRFKLEEARRIIGERLHLVPRFRKKLMNVAFQQGRPVWVDDDSFDLAYHVRLTALPRPGSEEQLRVLMGRLQAQVLDRRRPLWELWFVEGLEGGRVAIIQKTHHALIDGVSGVDVATVILDLEADPPPIEVPQWEPQPAPTSSRLLAESVIERATQPAEIVRSVRAAFRGPRQVAERAGQVAQAVTRGAKLAPKTPFNVRIGPHRRFEVARVDLAQVKAVKRDLGATVNDVVLAVVTGALRHFLLARGESVEGLNLRVMVPVSVRDESERMLLGNRVSAMLAELPVGEDDPRRRLELVHEQMAGLKESRQALGAELLVNATKYVPPTLLSLAARLVARQRMVNLTVTNVPGPQIPLYCMGARMIEAFPYVGPIDNMALIIGILSYDGRLCFGLSADRDVVADLAVLAEGIEKGMAELSAVTGQ
jgi:diacylglycerol O-acyltransferase / wax synthase